MAGVREVLSQLAMLEEAGRFEEAGFDDVTFMRTMGKNELVAELKAAGVKPGHVLKFCAAIGLR